jgi:type II secretory pathway pseudopilin PulG
MVRTNDGPEPLIVTAAVIFALTAVVLLFGLGGLQRRGPHGADAQISALSVALESYKIEYGDYPKATNAIGPSETANANILYQALIVSNAAYNPHGKLFFEPSKGNSSSTNFTSPANSLVDPFGRPYQYRYPGDPKKSGTNFFDLFSYGKSKNTADLPKNWETWAKNW